MELQSSHPLHANNLRARWALPSHTLSFILVDLTLVFISPLPAGLGRSATPLQLLLLLLAACTICQSTPLLVWFLVVSLPHRVEVYCVMYLLMAVEQCYKTLGFLHRDRYLCRFPRDPPSLQQMKGLPFLLLVVVLMFVGGHISFKL